MIWFVIRKFRGLKCISEKDVKEDIIITEDPNEDPITEELQWNRLTKDPKKGPITEDFKRTLSLKAPIELWTD